MKQMPAMHVLLVEDSAINRRFIELMLSKAGIQVTSAENGQVGMEMARDGEYDAILMDMQMPVMDGFQATTRLRQQGEPKPIIALTGHATEKDRQRCLEAGCDDHLTKPLDARGLLDALERAVATAPSVSAEAADESCEEFRQIALEYLVAQRRRIHEMAKSLENADFPSLAELAHRMKGTAGTVGFPQFTTPAEHLEEAALCGNGPACREVLEEMSDLQEKAETAT